MGGLTMKTPEEIKRWLRLMAHYCGDTICEKCEHRDICGKAPNAEDIAADILSYVRQLEAERDVLLKVARDYAGCSECKYVDNSPEQPPCNDCGVLGKNWTWRGAPDKEG
jgi:hypothetical protein